MNIIKLNQFISINYKRDIIPFEYYRSLKALVITITKSKKVLVIISFNKFTIILL